MLGVAEATACSGGIGWRGEEGQFALSPTNCTRNLPLEIACLHAEPFGCGKSLRTKDKRQHTAAAAAPASSPAIAACCTACGYSGGRRTSGRSGRGTDGCRHISND